MPITTCPKCSRLYEATSEEEANAPTRECGTCFALRKAEAQRADFSRQLAAEREHRMQLERIVDEVRARNRELEAAQSAKQRMPSDDEIGEVVGLVFRSINPTGALREWLRGLDGSAKREGE